MSKEKIETVDINPDLGLELEVTGEEVARDAIIDDDQVESGIDFNLEMIQEDVLMMNDDLVQDNFPVDFKIEDVVSEDTIVENVVTADDSENEGE